MQKGDQNVTLNGYLTLESIQLFAELSTAKEQKGRLTDTKDSLELLFARGYRLRSLAGDAQFGYDAVWNPEEPDSKPSIFKRYG